MNKEHAALFDGELSESAENEELVEGPEEEEEDEEAKKESDKEEDEEADEVDGEEEYSA